MVLLFLLQAANLFASVSSVGEPLVKWDRHEVRVCWGARGDDSRVSMHDRDEVRKLMDTAHTGSVPNKLRNQIRDLVESQFTEASTGIHFTGFKFCSASPASDLVLFLVEDSKNPIPMGVADVGQSGMRGNGGGFVFKDRTGAAYAFVRMGTYSGMKISSEELARINVLHELGHIAGLRHEHVRVAEATQDPNCDGVALDEPVDLSSRYYGPYDPSSIMNYCMINRVAKKSGFSAGETIGLSKGDVRALKCLYVYTPEEKQTYCQAESPLD